MTNIPYAKLSKHSKEQNVWRQRATDKAFRKLKQTHQKDWMTLYHRIEQEFRTMHKFELAQLRDMFIEDLRIDGVMRDGRRNRKTVQSDPSRLFSCPTCKARQYEVCRAKSGNWTRPHAARRALKRGENNGKEG